MLKRPQDGQIRVRELQRHDVTRAEVLLRAHKAYEDSEAGLDAQAWDLWRDPGGSVRCL